jgi:hypothetical protein
VRYSELQGQHSESRGLKNESIVHRLYYQAQTKAESCMVFRLWPATGAVRAMAEVETL